MELLKYLIIAIIVFFIVGFLIKKKKVKNKIFVSLVGTTVALAVLVFPLYKGNHIISQMVFSILYAIQTIFLSQDFELIGQIELNNNLIHLIYVVVIYVIFFLQPLTTATAIISLLTDYISKIQLHLARKKKALVFSEINEKTLAIARKEGKEKGVLLLFLYDSEINEIYIKEIKKLKGIVLSRDITDIQIDNNNITYYLFSNNQEKNLKDALGLLSERHRRKKVQMYVLSNSEEARLILDSCDKKGVQLELINEADRVIYNHLYTVPLYKQAINNQISILIVGCGKIGTEFLKAATWCGQMINHKLNINVIDINANKIKEKLDITCPELLANYNYNFIEADIYSKKAIEELDKLKYQNINYILVALEDENKNIEVAVFLRKYFLRQDTISYSRMPEINLWIENDTKKTQIDLLNYKEKKGEEDIIYSYNLTSFGSINEMYVEKPIIHSEIEELAKQVHCVHEKNDIQNKLKDFYDIEYNKKSSRAVAVHIKYKIYSILKDRYIGNLEDDLRNNLERVLEQYSIVVQNEEILQSLAKNEHDRWNAYMRTDGYRKVEKEEVEKYKAFAKKTKHFMARLHPDIVPFEQLDEITKSFDENMVINTENILRKNIYQE